MATLARSGPTGTRRGQQPKAAPWRALALCWLLLGSRTHYRYIYHTYQLALHDGTYSTYKLYTIVSRLPSPDCSYYSYSSYHSYYSYYSYYAYYSSTLTMALLLYCRRNLAYMYRNLHLNVLQVQLDAEGVIHGCGEVQASGACSDPEATEYMKVKYAFTTHNKPHTTYRVLPT